MIKEELRENYWLQGNFFFGWAVYKSIFNYSFDAFFFKVKIQQDLG